MLLAKKSIDPEELEKIIRERAAALGIPQEMLLHEVEGQSLHDLLCTLVSDVLDAEEIENASSAIYSKAIKYDAIVAEKNRIKAEQERERLRIQKIADLKAEQEKCEQAIANTMSKREAIMNEIKSLEGGM